MSFTLTHEIFERADGTLQVGYTAERDSGGPVDAALHHEATTNTYASRFYFGKGPRKVGTADTQVFEGDTVSAWVFEYDDLDRTPISNVVEYTVAAP
jgi:hypothetical protein